CVLYTIRRAHRSTRFPYTTLFRSGYRINLVDPVVGSAPLGAIHRRMDTPWRHISTPFRSSCIPRLNGIDLTQPRRCRWQGYNVRPLLRAATAVAAQATAQREKNCRGNSTGEGPQPDTARY